MMRGSITLVNEMKFLISKPNRGIIFKITSF